MPGWIGKKSHQLAGHSEEVELGHVGPVYKYSVIDQAIVVRHD